MWNVKGDVGMELWKIILGHGGLQGNVAKIQIEDVDCYIYLKEYPYFQ